MVEFPEVTKFTEAKEILIGEPYNVPMTSDDLKNKDSIRKKAGELGIGFPNLK